MPADRNYHIRPVLDGQTLAAGLRLLDARLSWADARKLVNGRHVWVNGNLVVDEARRLKAGDVVKVFEHPRAPVPTDRDVRVLYVDEDLVVVDKPAGITTLRHVEEQGWDDRRKQRQPTLDEVVQRLVPAALAAARRAGPTGAGGRTAPRRAGGGGASATTPDAAFGVIRRPGGRPVEPPRPDPPPKPSPRSTGRHAAGRSAGGAGGGRSDLALPVVKVRPVHRLDRDTSGLMLFALSPAAERALVSMFKDHTVRRSYLAVVHGRVAGPARFESWIARDRGDGHRGSTPSGREEPGSQRAVTHVRPERPIGDGYTVVRCQLETGRTHQIRIHLAEAGHMLCGEKTYVRPRADAPPVPDDSGAPRQALHSADLELSHPVTGEPLTFASPLAKDLGQWLARLGGRAPGQGGR